MTLDLRDCAFLGPALPEPFVKFQLEAELQKRKLLPKTSGDEGRALQDRWEVYRRKLRALGEQGGDLRVARHVLEPLAERLGYERFEPQAVVITREGPEDGGWLFTAADGRRLRAWSVGLDTDLDAPSRRGRAYRFSPSRMAQRVLLAGGERVGLLTDGEELRLLLCDPARPDSHIAIRLDRSGGWRAARAVPDSYLLLLALASPDGVAIVPELADAARLAQSTVTKKLRLQARRAIEGFVQELLDHPDNAAIRAEWPDSAQLAKALWREGLILVYRLLFVFKLESSADPARAFSFAATSLWRNTYSPNTALARLVSQVLDHGAGSGGFLESGLRALWRMFAEGMSSSELEIKPLGGMLFGKGATPLLDRLSWGERGVARLLDALLWTPGDGKTERERVHYGALDVEDLGRVYEALLELEPGITTEPMCRLRRAKLEVVVPIAQGNPYRTDLAPDVLEADDDTDTEFVDADEEDEAPKGRRKAAAGSKTKVQFIEEIPAERFFLRVGLGRKASGSYYTPHPFVRFLVQETLGPQLSERSPKEDPQPGRILKLKVLDPAMGSGHFLVEACRYLGEALYESCRLCDELAVQAEEQAEKVAEAERGPLLTRAAELRKRVEDLPDPDDELVAYLPSRATEGEESGLSQKKAEALCRRLVAVHCLYGVDKNPLAVELAKLSLWLESYAEGLPLTFMDHRLIQGDSLTGPFFEHLLTYPKSGEKLDNLFAQGLTERLQATLAAALVHVRDLEASVGKDVADLEHKRAAKEKLDAALAPLKTLAAAWSGGVMLGDDCDDAGYQALARVVATGEDISCVLALRPGLCAMVGTGAESVAFQLAFPEVFTGGVEMQGGFDAVLGNPPWEKIRVERRDTVALLNASMMIGREAAGVAGEHVRIQDAFDSSPELLAYQSAVVRLRAVAARTTLARLAVRDRPAILDQYHLFLLRLVDWIENRGRCGVVVGGGLQKSPTEEGLRGFLFAKYEPELIAHYFNIRQLFHGASSRVSFVLLVLGRPRSRDLRIGQELSEFEHIHEGTSSCRLHELQPGPVELGPMTADGGRTDTRPSLDELERRGINVSEGLHRTGNKPYIRELRSVVDADDARIPSTAATVLSQGYACLYGGRSIDFYDALPTGKSGKWLPQVDLVVSLKAPLLKANILSLAHYRLAWRNTCGFVATNERSSRSVVLPPGVAAAGSLILEKTPERRPNQAAIAAVAVLNSFAFDSQVRSRVQTNFNKAVLSKTVWPVLRKDAATLTVHSALRLSSCHAGYAPLWWEQLGDAWREPTPKHTWPVLEGEDARWAVRAAIDAVVADAYGLDRTQYEHVLSTFSHKSYPKAPNLCLAAFDKLKAMGLEAFTKEHDPYWDIPLNESLPKPVIDLPIPGAEAPARQGLGSLFEWAEGVVSTPAKIEPLPSAPIRSPTPAWLSKTPVDRQVLILSRVVDAHERADRLRTLGNVKAEKIVYLVEAHAAIDLQREPVREAAGPADFPRLKKAIHRGAKLHAFSVRGGSGGQGGIWSAGGGLRKRLEEYRDLFADQQREIDRVIDLLVPMDSERAEIVATLYACWNDLLASGAQPDDASIIADFHSWAVGKRRFDADRLGKALVWMREHDLVPSGSGPSTKPRGAGDRGKAGSRGKSTAAADEVYALVTSLLDERGVISSTDAQEATGLEAAEVRTYLKRLVEEGRAITEGQRRGVKYRRSDG